MYRLYWKEVLHMDKNRWRVSVHLHLKFERNLSVFNFLFFIYSNSIRNFLQFNNNNKMFIQFREVLWLDWKVSKDCVWFDLHQHAHCSSQIYTHISCRNIQWKSIVLEGIWFENSLSAAMCWSSIIWDWVGMTVQQSPVQLSIAEHCKKSAIFFRW